MLQTYRRFESPLVRQQVSDVTRESLIGEILRGLPKVSCCSCASRPLRERVSRALRVQCRPFLRSRLCPASRRWRSASSAFSLPFSNNGPTSVRAATIFPICCSRGSSQTRCMGQPDSREPQADNTYCVEGLTITNSPLSDGAER